MEGQTLYLQLFLIFVESLFQKTQNSYNSTKPIVGDYHTNSAVTNRALSGIEQMFLIFSRK